MKLSPAMRNALAVLLVAPAWTFIDYRRNRESFISGAPVQALRALKARGLVVAEAGHANDLPTRREHGHYIHWRLTPAGRALLEKEGT